MTHHFKNLIYAILFLFPTFLLAQSDDTAIDDTGSEASAEDLLTQAELENLVAPVALYPDTLLIQVLVAATYPLEIVKAERLLADNAEVDPEDLKPQIEAEEWDPSVEVLATAFPDVISEMADHIEWTETVGDAMMAQSEDVMDAVQTMRDQAINSGALISNDAQTVDVEDENVIIQPADPEIVYVPEYDPNVVYNDDNLLSDAIVTGAIIFGTVALMDEIFDDDDDWDDYWGCRNCGGWGGGPIYRNPDIDIDIDGNVNIGNNIDIGDRPDRRPDGGWKPGTDRADKAEARIRDKRGADGKTKLPVKKGDSRGDKMRRDLADRSGAKDISRPGADAKAGLGGLGSKPGVNRPSKRPDANKAAAKRKTSGNAGNLSTKKKPAVKKSTNRKPTTQKTKSKRSSATKKRASSGRSKSGRSRGRSSGGKRGGRR